jgi:hypothetical protein
MESLGLYLWKAFLSPPKLGELSVIEKELRRPEMPKFSVDLRLPPNKPKSLFGV